ncbi:uncharacterized protein VTP21DRAFT_10803 [Calcarisporiella thermophila]|uniref:uncharacterized protein n=1 Tax=Calcarisporiella thermophila TaxID=911321 RepID=UPI003743FA44
MKLSGYAVWFTCIILIVSSITQATPLKREIRGVGPNGLVDKEAANSPEAIRRNEELNAIFRKKHPEFFQKATPHEQKKMESWITKIEDIAVRYGLPAVGSFLGELIDPAGGGVAGGLLGDTLARYVAVKFGLEEHFDTSLPVVGRIGKLAKALEEGAGVVGELPKGSATPGKGATAPENNEVPVNPEENEVIPPGEKNGNEATGNTEVEGEACLRKRGSGSLNRRQMNCNPNQAGPSGNRPNKARPGQSVEAKSALKTYFQTGYKNLIFRASQSAHEMINHMRDFGLTPNEPTDLPANIELNNRSYTTAVRSYLENLKSNPGNVAYFEGRYQTGTKLLKGGKTGPSQVVSARFIVEDGGKKGIKLFAIGKDGNRANELLYAGNISRTKLGILEEKGEVWFGKKP